LHSDSTLVSGGTGTALTATLTKFGASGNSSTGFTFEFLFSNATGYLRTLEGFGPNGGIIISGTGGTFGGAFGGNFTAGTAVADTFAVPVPKALPAGLLLLSGIFAWRRASRIIAD